MSHKGNSLSVNNVCLLSIILLLSVLVSYGPAAPPVSSGTIPGESQVKELKVGCTLPLNQAMGIEAKKCLDIVVDQTNSDGGVRIKGETYKIKMIVYDDKYTADGGRAAVEKLVNEDKVKFLVAQLGSAPVLGGLPIAEDNKIPTIAYAVSDKIASTEFKYTYRQSGISGGNWVYLKKSFPNLKTMVAFTIDDETGRHNARAQTTAGKAYMGIKVLPPVYFPRDTVDFAPFATKIKNLNPDLVSFWGGLPGTQLGLQFKSLYEMGWRGVKTMSVINLGEILSVCPKEAAEGLIFSYGDPTEFAKPTKAALRLKDAYVKKYGKWDYTGATLIDPFLVFVQMLKKADSLDPAAIQAAVAGFQFQGIATKGAFIKRPDLGNDRVCDTMREVTIGVIRDGKATWPGLVTLDEVKAFAEIVYDHQGKWGY